MPTKLFNPANAREMQAKGQAVKDARLQDLRATNDLLRETIAEDPEDFRNSMLLSVRAQTKLILSRIDKELEKPGLDTKALKELADTLARFEAMEQKLSMRAGPGSLKPTAARQPKGRTANNPPPEPEERPKPASQDSI